MMKPDATLVQADLLEPLINETEIKDSNGHLVSGEDTPAYSVLQAYDLLNGNFRKASFDDIFNNSDLHPNATHSDIYNNSYSWHWYSGDGCCLGMFYQFQACTVPPGCIMGFVDDDNNYLFAKPGSHLIKSPFIKKLTPSLQVSAGAPITHGNRTVVTVPQG